MDKLKDLFKKPEYAILSRNKLLLKLKEDKINIDVKTVDKFLSSLDYNQLIKKKMKKKKFNSVIANYPGDAYQIDIIIYDRYEINKYKYILCVIDVYSRYAQVKPMTTRKNNIIIDNLLEIFKDMGLPYRIQCDNEFNTKEFNKLMNDYDVKITYSDPDEINKNSIVERFNKTLEGLISKFRLAYKKYNWYKYIDKIIDIYNDTFHTTVKNKPIDIWEDKAFNHQEVIRIPTEFEVGDKVRIITYKKLLGKADQIINSKEIYIITDIKKDKIKLDNGKFYKPYQLLKIEDVIYLDKDDEEEVINEALQKEKKIKNKLKKVGISIDNIKNTKRTVKKKILN